MDKVSDDDLKAKLNYIGLDLDNVPEFLQTYEPLNFNPSRLNNDKDHRIYKYVPIDKIQIVLTKNLRNEDVRKKYSEAVPLCRFLNPQDTPEDLERYTTFLKMLRKVSISEIENIDGIQKQLDNSVPFKVKYEKNHLWQIYYSEATEKYFMMVCTEENTFAEFFYLLKKQIEASKLNSQDVPKIFVPINYINYTENFLTKSEILDLENYIWLFTKNWCLVFEVFDKKNKMSLQIVGETFVYENVKSSYNIKLKSADEAATFYKLLKALFIMQTEINDKYKFTTKINSRNSLEFYKDEELMSFEDLTDFIKREYEKTENDIEIENNKTIELEERLKKLKNQAKELEEEYMIKQKEISIYLEYKKTFFGKMKYFFKSSKINSKLKNKASVRSKLDEIYHKEVNVKPMQTYLDEKKYHTLEDLITINTLYEKGQKYAKDLNLDIKAMELKVINLAKKIENATLYIEEIDKHKKSIWDFWKFANKDEILSLEMGNEDDDEAQKGKIKKTFDYELDFEQLGMEVDRKQRIKLSKEELDSLYVAKTNMLYILNMIRSGDMNKVALENALEILRKEFDKDRLYIGEETFDIFGNLSDEMTKVKYIGNKSHRENERNKINILNINKKIDIFDFTEKIQSIVNYLNEAINKMQTMYEMPVYKLVPINERVKEECFDIYNINLEKELEEYEEKGEGALNLVKLNLKENMPMLYYSNITLYENQNKTLPEGMDLSTNVLLDCSKFEFELLRKEKFRTNNYFLESNNLVSPKTKDIFVYEYDVTLKDNSKKEKKEDTKIKPKIEDAGKNDIVEDNNKDEEDDEVIKDPASKKKGFFNKRKKIEKNLEDIYEEENSEESVRFQKKNKGKEIILDEEDEEELEEAHEIDLDEYDEEELEEEHEIDLDEEDEEELEEEHEIDLDEEDEEELEEEHEIDLDEEDEEELEEHEINLDEEDDDELEEAHEIDLDEEDDEEELEKEQEINLDEEDDEEELEEHEIDLDEEDDEKELEEHEIDLDEEDDEKELEETHEKNLDEDDDFEDIEDVVAFLARRKKELENQIKASEKVENIIEEKVDKKLEEDIESEDFGEEIENEEVLEDDIEDEEDINDELDEEIEDDDNKSKLTFFEKLQQRYEKQEDKNTIENKTIEGVVIDSEENKLEKDIENKVNSEQIIETEFDVIESNEILEENNKKKLESASNITEKAIDEVTEEKNKDEKIEDNESVLEKEDLEPEKNENKKKAYNVSDLEEDLETMFACIEALEDEEAFDDVFEDDELDEALEDEEGLEDESEDDDEEEFTSKKFGVFGTDEMKIVEPEYEEKFLKNDDNDELGLDEIFGKKLEITYEEIDLKEYEKKSNTKNGELKEIVIDNTVVERDDDDWDFDEDDEDFITLDDLEKQVDLVEEDDEIEKDKVIKVEQKEEKKEEKVQPLRKSKRGRPPKAKVEEKKQPAKRGRKKKSEG